MTKCCTKCHKEYPKTKEYFAPNKQCKDGLTNQCRKCRYAATTFWKKRMVGFQSKYRKTIKGYVTCLVGDIKQRCNNPKRKRYKYYGGRGIRGMFNSAELYDWLVANDIDPRGLCIHRVNNDGDYTLDNIEFLDRSSHQKLHRLEKKGT